MQEILYRVVDKYSAVLTKSFRNDYALTRAHDLLIESPVSFVDLCCQASEEFSSRIPAIRNDAVRDVICNINGKNYECEELHKRIENKMVY